MGTLYRVGGLFDPGRTIWPEGSHLWIDNDGDVRLGIFVPDPHRREVTAVQAGASRFAWTEQSHNGFLLFKFGDTPWTDTPFTPHRLSTPFQADLRPRGTHSRMVTTLVNANTGRIAALRMCTWPAYFLNHVIVSVRRLKTRHFYQPDAVAAMQDFYRRHPDGPSLYRLVSTLPPGASCLGGQRDDRPS